MMECIQFSQNQLVQGGINELDYILDTIQTVIKRNGKIILNKTLMTIKSLI